MMPHSLVISIIQKVQAGEVQMLEMLSEVDPLLEVDIIAPEDGEVTKM